MTRSRAPDSAGAIVTIDRGCFLSTAFQTAVLNILKRSVKDCSVVTVHEVTWVVNWRDCGKSGGISCVTGARRAGIPHEAYGSCVLGMS